MPEPNPYEGLLTTGEVARLLQVNETRVRQLADKGLLGQIKRISRGHAATARLFDPAAVEAYRASRPPRRR